MTYVAWSVTFGEQPTAAKWNILGTNDASFNDGTGIGTSAIDSDNLQTDSHIIAYDEGPATGQSTTSTSDVDVTGVSVTFTTPLSCTKILLRAEASVSNNTANASIVLGITDSSNVVQVDRSTIANDGHKSNSYSLSFTKDQCYREYFLYF